MNTTSSAVDYQIDIPGVGGISTETIDALSALCERVENSNRIATVALRVLGAPGPDGAVWPGDAGTVELRLVSQWERVLRRLELLPARTVSLVRGSCSLLALEILLTTDHRVAAPDASIRLRNALGGAWPSMAVYRLVANIGQTRARRLLSLAPDLTAEMARRFDLIDEVGGEDSLERLAARFTSSRVADIALHRRLVFDAASTSYEEALGSHLAACDRTLRRAAERANAPA